MNNASAILRTLIVYAICVPLAIWIGFMLTSLEDFSRSTFIATGIFALLLCMPLLLRWHYVIMVFCFSFPMIIFFLPGRPPVWLPALALSLGISVLQRTLNKEMRFISAPRITWPLIFLLAVVLVTAKFTGGIGLRTFGGSVMGGNRYFYLLGGILAYFAVTARRIPPERAGFYIALFILSGCFNVIGDLVAVLPSAFNFIFWFFPPNGYIMEEMGASVGGLRLSGVAGMSSCIFSFMLAKYGVRGIFLSGKPWRPVVFVCFSFLVLVGGFRSAFINCALIFLTLFYLEKLHRTRLMPILIFAGIIIFALAVPFTQKLPYVVQRSLAFLPVPIDPIARQDARGSADWRIEIWKAVLPQVPEHLLLGKGYVFTEEDYQFSTSNMQVISADERGSALAGDYHNGPLSVILTFGIWGVIVFLWFLIAAFRGLYDNYRYGDPSLRTINTYLLGAFIGHVLMFFIIFGGFHSDMLAFAAVIGLSVSLNGGIRRPATQDVVKPLAPAFNRPRLQAGFQR